MFFNEMNCQCNQLIDNTCIVNEASLISYNIKLA